MSNNTFGTLFRITTWGESHGKALGVCIDGCPAGLPLTVEEINLELSRRAPGQNALMSPRKEPDVAEIFSGLFEGKTTGAPLSILIFNKDADSSKYEPIKDLLRPGHAGFTYLSKYGIYDYRGSGRASARETVCRVAAGAVAKKLLTLFGIQPSGTVIQVGSSKDPSLMEKEIEKAMANGTSVGGIIEVIVNGLPVGLGEPIFGKAPALLAHAMLSLPAVKAFEMGDGFALAAAQAEDSNDLFEMQEGKVMTSTNHSGGTLGGITNGMPLIFKVGFKPPSSIPKSQPTLTTSGEKATLELPPGSRHDPCVVFRAVPIVEAMTALVLADLLLLNQKSTVGQLCHSYKELL